MYQYLTYTNTPHNKKKKKKKGDDRNVLGILRLSENQPSETDKISGL